MCACQPAPLSAGLVASGSILIEKKSRRSELALYVMPRAVDSFVLALTKKRCLPSIKFGEVILFSMCMGGLMYYRYFSTLLHQLLVMLYMPVLPYVAYGVTDLLIVIRF